MQKLRGIAVNPLRTRRSGAGLALAASIGLAGAGCGEWPRFAHRGVGPIDGPHRLPIEAESIDERLTGDWGGNDGGEQEAPLGIALDLAAQVDVSAVTPFEYVRLTGTLAPFGSLDGEEEEDAPPVFSCGQDLARTVRGRYTGDVDFVRLQPGAFESLCAFLLVPPGGSANGCVPEGAEGVSLDIVAYGIADPDATRCDSDLLEGGFLTLPGVSNPQQPAWTKPGSFMPIDVSRASDVLLYVAGVGGCSAGDLDYELRLVPVRNAARCVDLVSRGMAEWGP